MYEIKDSIIVSEIRRINLIIKVSFMLNTEQLGVTWLVKNAITEPNGSSVLPQKPINGLISS
jgi:hypothetical protein